MSEKVFLNDGIIDATKARIHVSNPGLLHGVGLFETLRSYHGKPFRLEEHVNRLRTSAARFDMPVDPVIERIPHAVRAVLSANKLSEARIRITVTPPGACPESADPTLLVAAQHYTGYAPELYVSGMTVFVCTDYRQSPNDPLAGHKTTCYFPRLLVLRNAQNRRCGEALWFTPTNHLAEGCVSNAFLVKGGVLRTPPLSTPVLPGVTRAVILELADGLGIRHEQIPCTIDDLLDADEVFLTNAGMQVMPVTRVEKRAIGSEKPGPLTLRLAEAFQEKILA